MADTRNILNFQSDLKRSSVPTLPDDVTNKAYVDAAVVAGAPLATSAPGGGSEGIVTADEDFGIEIVGGPTDAELRVKIDGVTVTFNGLGELVASPTVPTATSAAGGGVQGKVTADENKGLLITAGIMEVRTDTTKGIEFSAGQLAAKVDGVSVIFNGFGELAAVAAAPPNATSAPGGGVKGISTYDSNFGLEIVGGPSAIARVKVDGSTVLFNGSGQLQAAGASFTGLVSDRAALTKNIPAVTAPTPVVLGTNIDASSYPDGVTTGEKFELTVGDDYFGGSIDIMLVFSMSSAVASPNNIVRISTAAEIVNTSTGLIDSASYPETQQNLVTPDNTTFFTRSVVLSIAPGGFNVGDTIVVSIKRFGAHASDAHTGALQIVAYEWRYTAVVDSRAATQGIEFFTNAAGENPVGSVVLGTNVDAITYPTGLDAGAKFTFTVPENWDGASDAIVSITYAMSSAAVGNLRLNTYGEIADTVGGSIAAVVSQNYDFSPPVSTNVTRRTGVRAIPAALLHIGDQVTLVMARRTAIGGNHAGTVQLVSVQVVFAVAPSSGFNAVTITEAFLEQPVFGNPVGIVNGTQNYPLFGTTFDALVEMNSSSAAGRLDVAFEGRLSGGQTQIAQLKINIVGTGPSPQYQLLIYADGSGGVPVYSSGVGAAPGVLTEIIVLAAALSAQPTGLKRYHVVVEAYIDVGEAIFCSMPFVRQE